MVTTETRRILVVATKHETLILAMENMRAHKRKCVTFRNRMEIADGADRYYFRTLARTEDLDRIRGMLFDEIKPLGTVEHSLVWEATMMTGRGR